MTAVSIVIVNWNTRELLRDCLRSIYRETTGINFEVIVVDNASSDRSVEMVRQEFPSVVLIASTENEGFAVANNRAFTVAKGRYVLLLNPDTIILDKAIQKSITFAETQPRAGVVGVRNDDANGQLTKNCFQYASLLNLLITTFGLHRAFPKNRFFGRERMSWWDYSDSRKVNVVAGCYMLVRREAMDEVGGFDEAYFMYGEEMDWCWRFNRAGWEVWYYCNAKIIHYGGMSAAQNPTEMLVHGQRSFLLFIQKRQGVVARLIASALIGVSGALRVVYWSLCWLIAGQGSRELSSKKLRQSVTATFGR